MASGARKLTATLFYNHLDGCSQCRDNPFNLCLLGAQLLAAAATHCSNATELNDALQEVRLSKRASKSD
jgi:hypothetical protein